MNPLSPAQQVKKIGREVGFDLVCIAPATELVKEQARFLKWIEGGRQADMRWLTDGRAVAATTPPWGVPDAQSVVCVGVNYWAGHRTPPGATRGKIARYAWGVDYHSVIGNALDEFMRRLRDSFGGTHRWYVDTGPISDKALAARSGIGWYGKNTNILTERFGSFALLGEIVTTLPLDADVPIDKDCGKCSLCTIACPTRALGPDYSIDARRCISYLTIEHREAIPHELREAIGSWVFGCDICQDVCPPTMQPFLTSQEDRRAWAEDVRSLLDRREPSALRPSSVDQGKPKNAVGRALVQDGLRQDVDLVWLLQLTHADYLQAFRNSAIRRAKVWMLRRNAAIALGNVGTAACIPALSRALCEDDHPVVRGHAAWALGRIGRRFPNLNARAALHEACKTENNTEVQAEIEAALAAE